MNVSDSNPAVRGDLTEKVVAVKRVAKVVKGGRRFSFAALVVVGDGRGSIGYGTGKAREVASAIRKASGRAQRHMIKIPMKQGRTLFHDVEGSYGAGRVKLRSAPPGTGVIAGGSVRSVLEVVGFQDVVSKNVGSSNAANMVLSVFDSFQKIESPRQVAARRSCKVEDLFFNEKTKNSLEKDMK